MSSTFWSQIAPLVEYQLRSPSSEDTPATHSSISVCNYSCVLLQVEDLTTSHEAALLEMENNHTVAIAILQDDHHHKVQGSYQPRCGQPFVVGCASQDVAATLPLLLLFPFPPPLHPGVSFVLLLMERRDEKSRIHPGNYSFPQKHLLSNLPGYENPKELCQGTDTSLGSTWESHVAAVGFLRSF